MNYYYQPYYQQNTGVLWVSGELEAQNYPVAPNNAVALWDSSKPAVYLKQADASGRPSIKYYTLVERSEMPEIKQNSQECKITDYALKSDLAAIESAIAALKKEVNSLKRGNDDE